MFILLKMVLIGIDPYPFHLWQYRSTASAAKERSPKLRRAASEGTSQRAHQASMASAASCSCHPRPEHRGGSSWFQGCPGIPSGKRLHNYAKSPFLMGKSTMPFSIAMLNYQRVNGLGVPCGLTFFCCFFPETEDQYWERRDHSLIEKPDGGKARQLDISKLVK